MHITPRIEKVLIKSKKKVWNAGIIGFKMGWDAEKMLLNQKNGALWDLIPIIPFFKVFKILWGIKNPKEAS